QEARNTSATNNTTVILSIVYVISTLILALNNASRLFYGFNFFLPIFPIISKLFQIKIVINFFIKNGKTLIIRKKDLFPFFLLLYKNVDHNVVAVKGMDS